MGCVVDDRIDFPCDSFVCCCLLDLYDADFFRRDIGRDRSSKRSWGQRGGGGLKVLGGRGRGGKGRGY